jgi:arylsulfatase A-like enzyme
MGNPLLKTPNIDRFATEGVRFTQALAGVSVCAPTRCCLMTGKHSGHTSVRKNDGGTPMREGEETIASMLKQAGYATGGFGKWGCGGRGSTGVPEKHGFDVFVGYYDQVHAHSYYPKYIVRNSEELPLPGNRGGSEGTNYSHYTIMREGLEFIRASRDRPFFCYLPITPPHGIFDIPDSDPAWALFKDEEWPEDAKRYAAMVAMVDRNLGEVVSLLKELDLDNNTIIFFCGDNGGQDRFRSPEHPHGFFGPNVDPKTGQAFRGSKGNLYEGGLRIPMMVRWPGRVAPNRVSDLLWYFPDVLPTVAEICGVEPPADIDGISIVPELIGEHAAGRKQQQHEFLYWEYGRQTAVRMGDWKAIRPAENRPWELYDLSRDLSEENDVAGEHPQVLARMTACAEQAHTPAEEGIFHDRSIHERDRQAKYGDTRAAAKPGKVNAFPTEGLIPAKDCRLARVSSESTFNNRHAKYAIDGNPRSVWHTRFQGKVDKHPHELVIDLGKPRSVSGFRYLARQDSGWNGTFGRCEFFVSDSTDKFGEPVIEAILKKTKEAQEVTCEPAKGRYVLVRVRSEVNGNAWASAAELGVIGQ